MSTPRRPVTTTTRSSLLCGLLLLLAPRGAGAQDTPDAELRAGLWPSGGGTSLALVRHDVQVLIRQPLAEITVTQEFDNPSSMQLEAYYYYPVPRGATVTGLALWVNGVRREARLMERQQAREIYQGIVNQKRDPALVERLSDELFRIRIFPVPARGRQRVELRFAQPLELLERGHSRLVLRRPPGPTSHALRLGVELHPVAVPDRSWLVGYSGRLAPAGAGGGYVLPLAAAQRSFEREIEVHFTLPEQSAGRAAVAAQPTDEETTFVAELPRLARTGAPRRVALLVDVSKSMLRSGQLSRARRLADAALGALPHRAAVQLLPFDLLPREGPPELRAAAMEPAAAFRVAALRAWLAQLEASGGSAFVPAFEAAFRAGAQQIVLITDGASPGHQAELEHLLRRVFDRRDATVSVLLLDTGEISSARPQLDPLREMAHTTGGLFERWTGDERDGAAAAALIKRLLLRPRALTARALIGGAAAKGHSLHVLSGSTQDRLLVAGRVPAAAWAGRAGGRRALRVLLGDGSGHDLELPAASGVSLPAASGESVPAAGAVWADAAIARLMQQIRLFGEEELLRPQIVALSQRHNVASEYTAYLVTETDADYLRPTSGQQWQRQVQRLGDDAPPGGFHSTPEPHEVLLVGLGLLLLWAARRRGWLGAS